MVQRALRDMRRARRAEAQCEALETELAVVRHNYQLLRVAYDRAVLSSLEERA